MDRDYSGVVGRSRLRVIGQEWLGEPVGDMLGDLDGETEGDRLGLVLGLCDGDALGDVGASVGEGISVGCSSIRYDIVNGWFLVQHPPSGLAPKWADQEVGTERP